MDAKFDLTLELLEDGQGGLFGRLEYCSALFDPGTAASMTQHFNALLQSVTANEEQRWVGLAGVHQPALFRMAATGPVVPPVGMPHLLSHLQVPSPRYYSTLPPSQPSTVQDR